MENGTTLFHQILKKMYSLFSNNPLTYDTTRNPLQNGASTHVCYLYLKLMIELR